jgi:hypothetical protein
LAALSFMPAVRLMLTQESADPVELTRRGRERRRTGGADGTLACHAARTAP